MFDKILLLSPVCSDENIKGVALLTKEKEMLTLSADFLPKQKKG
jgi:hypothetical protein